MCERLLRGWRQLRSPPVFVHNPSAGRGAGSERGQPEPRGVSHRAGTWPAAGRAGWHPPALSIFHSPSPKIDSKEVSQSNFLLLEFVVPQASNCGPARETQRTSLS